MAINIQDGRYTIVSNKTGNHRSFKIETATTGRYAGSQLVSLRMAKEDNNRADSSWFTIGFITKSEICIWRERCKENKLGIEFFEKLAIAVFNTLGGRSKNELIKCVKCSVCNEWLYEPESIRNGYGPVCAKKLHHHEALPQIKTFYGYGIVADPKNIKLGGISI